MSTDLSRSHCAFAAALPMMTRVARKAFRNRPTQDRDEAIAETHAIAWRSWYGLIERGRDPVAVGVQAIAQNAIRSVRKGRRTGNTSCSSRAVDVFHFRARQHGGHAMISIDCQESSGADSWRESLATDGHATPADEVAFRVDFQEWLDRLPARKRQVAELLAAGYTPGDIATMFGMAPSSVRDVRQGLRVDYARVHPDEFD